MNIAKRVLISVLMATVVGVLIGEQRLSHGADTAGISSPSFVAYDGTLYRTKPDFTQHGIQPLKIIYGREFYAEGESHMAMPKEKHCRTLAKQYYNTTSLDLAVINLENWPLKGSPSVVQDGLTKYLTVLRWFHAEAPNLKIGYYGRPPISDYSRAILDPSRREYQAWQAENDAIRSLYSETDVFFPSVYTFYSDREGWVKYAVAQISEARRLGNGRPVYVFMWPQYHPSNRLLAYQYISSDFWELQLQTARQYADGIVIWGGWDFDNNRPAEWDESASWWQVTKKFMEGQKPTVPPASFSVK